MVVQRVCFCVHALTFLAQVDNFDVHRMCFLYFQVAGEIFSVGFYYKFECKYLRIIRLEKPNCMSCLLLIMAHPNPSFTFHNSLSLLTGFALCGFFEHKYRTAAENSVTMMVTIVVVHNAFIPCT